MEPVAPPPPGFDAPPSLWEEVRTGWTSPGRHYHTLQHLGETLAQYREVQQGPGWRQPREVFLALLAHDLVYDVTRQDNEAQSAMWGARWAERLGLQPERVAALVNATASHGGAQMSPQATQDTDLLLFLDCDLAVLGASPARYAEYARGVAAEYAPLYPEPLFRAGRLRFVQSMLAQPQVFHTQFFRDRLEAAARANLQTELSALR
jgi:predicted metal-dependent HD superfamily phosphohydrolase